MKSLIESMPESFPFYHLGTVSSEPSIHKIAMPTEFTDSQVIGFQLLGDLQGWLVLVIDKGLDLQIYSEVGNIIAGQFSTRLSKILGGEVMISPPRSITAKTLATLLQNDLPLLVRQYRHVFDDHSIPIQTLFFKSSVRPAKNMQHLLDQEGARA